MEIKGVCRITNKFDAGGNIQRNEYQLEEKQSKTGEEYAIGRLSYSSAKKVNGKYQNTYISKSFSCFHPATINFLKRTLGNPIEINGQLRIENYIDKNNKSQTIEKIIITSANHVSKIGEKPQDRKEEAVSDNHDDEVPF